MDKDRIAFSYDKVGPGVFKVSPEQALAPGEYGFLYFMGGGGGAGMQAAASTTRVFDFSVTEAAGGKHSSLRRGRGFDWPPVDRKGGVWGTSVSVRVDLGGRGVIKK